MGPLKFSRSQVTGHQKGRVLRPFFYGLLLVIPATAGAETLQGLSFEFDSVSYSEATSIHSISGHWEDEVTSGDVAFTVDRAYLGYAYGPFSIQYVMRYDAYYDYANETAEIIFLTKNKRPLRAGDQYRLFIGADKSSSKGFRFGYSDWLTDEFKLSAYLSLLELTDIEQGKLIGSATVIDENDYDFDFDVDMVYEDDPLFERDTGEIYGDGYSLDLSLHYVINPGWRLQVDVFDLVSKMRVDNVPFTTASASSDVKEFDENGYVTFNPVVNGFEGNKSYSFEFNRQTHLALDYRRANDDRIVLQHHDYVNVEYQEINYIQHFGQNRLSWNLIPEFGAIGLSFHRPGFRIILNTDNVDYDEMKYLHLSFELFLALD